MELKKINFTGCLLISWVVSFGASPTAAAVDIRLGVVNFRNAMEVMAQQENLKQTLQKEFASRERKLSDAQKKLKQMEDRLAKDGSIMSDSERAKLDRDLNSGKRELKRDFDEYREDRAIRENEEVQKLQKQVVDTIRAIAKEEGYDLIVGEGVIYASDKVDVTQRVVERLKKGYKGK